MEHIFWKDGDYEGQGGVFVRNDLCKFFEKLQEKGLNPVGIKMDGSWNLEIILERNEAFKIMYESDSPSGTISKQ